MTLEELLALLLSGDLANVTDEQLAEYEATLLLAFSDHRATARGAEALAQLGQIADAADAVREEAGRRIDAAVADAAAIEELAARLAPAASDTEPEAPAEPDPAPEAAPEVEAAAAPAPAPEVEREPVLVSSAAPAVPAPRVTNLRPRLAPLASLASDAPPAATQRPNQFSVVGRPVDAPAPTLRELAEAFITQDRQIGMADYVKYHSVFSLHGDYPEAQRLRMGDNAHNERVMESLYGPNALTAGVMCGPATPYYQLAEVTTAIRPAHDFVTSLSASERGKVTLNRPFALSDFSDAVGVWTDDDNEDPDALKNCTTIDCTATVTAEVEAFTRCLTINNMQARYSPEHVAQAIQKTLVNWAMLSEGALLDSIKGASILVDISTAPLGSLPSFLYTLGAQSERYRNSERMDPEAVLDTLLPHWSIPMFAGNQARTSHQYQDMLRYTRENLVGEAANLGVRLGFYIDTPSTGPSQRLASQTAGPALDYPESMQWGLWHSGAHAVLDGGPDLNFGLVRDPDSNRQNTYQTFGESFEGYVFLGVKSNWYTQKVCASGIYSAAVDMENDLCASNFDPGS